MKTTKIGAMFLISILALAGIGVGFAAWTDTITIDGEVNTGSVGWYFSGVSGTWVWKDTVKETCIETTTSDPPNVNCELIAHSKAVIDPDDDHHVTLTFDGLFPCINFIADFTITYTGTVPGKINKITATDFWQDTKDEITMDPYTKLDITIYDVDGTTIKYQWLDTALDPSIFCGAQLHKGYTIYVVMRIHLEQLDILMGLTGSFDMDVEVVQWNEYPYQHP